MFLPPKRLAKTSSKVEKEQVEVLTWQEKLENAIEDLTESKSSSREESLETLVETFSCHLVSSNIEDRLEEVLALLKRSLLKGGSSKESSLASRAIGLTFLNMVNASESEADDLYRRILPSLKSVIKASEDIDAKVNGLQNLALITYTAASDVDKQLIRDFIFEIIETDGMDFNLDDLDTTERDTFFAAAIQAYGIVFAASFTSGFVDFDVLWEEVEKVMPVHELLLESSDKDVRIVAGENIALIFETVNIFLASDSDEEEDEEKFKPEYDNMDGLIRTLKDLSTDSNRRRAKTDRVETKSAFRDVLRTVEENIKPSEELKINGRVLAFRGWSKILLLNTFRKVFGQGFQQQLKVNPMLKSILRYSSGVSSRQQDSDDSDDGGYVLSNVEKKEYHDSSKKSRTKQLRSARLSKESSPY